MKIYYLHHEDEDGPIPVHIVDDVDARIAELEHDLERYKRALYQANGQLIQLDKDPVKLEYGAAND